MVFSREIGQKENFSMDSLMRAYWGNFCDVFRAGEGAGFGCAKKMTVSFKLGFGRVVSSFNGHE